MTATATARPTTEYHYTTYIKSTPEQVWAALTTPSFTRQYWGKGNYSDWRPGSRWEHRLEEGAPQMVGIVRESRPPHRLVMTWATPADEANPAAHSCVTFEIEAIEGMVRLHVTHADLPAGSSLATGVANGWPRVLCSLKSMLETGAPLNTWAGNTHNCSASA